MNNCFRTYHYSTVLQFRTDPHILPDPDQNQSPDPHQSEEQDPAEVEFLHKKYTLNR